VQKARSNREMMSAIVVSRQPRLEQGGLTRRKRGGKNKSENRLVGRFY